MKCWWVVVLAAGACGGDGKSKTPDAAPADAAIDAQLRTVHGTYVSHWLTPAGQTDFPADLSHASVGLYTVPSFTQLFGTGASDGTFSIPDVPVGQYYFAAGTHFYVSSADTLDLDFFLVGRPRNATATSTTNLAISATGLAAWQTTDELEMYAPESGTLAFDLASDAGSGAPVANDTALTNLTYNLALADRPALLLAAQDMPVIAQLATQTDGTNSYRSVARTFSPTPFTVTNGGTASMTGAFTTVAANQALQLTWDRPAYAAEVAAHFPHAQLDNWSTFAISALQGAPAHGFYDEGPDVLVFAPGYGTTSSAVTINWSYGDPFPAEWGRIAFLRYERYRFIQLPGTTTSTAIYSEIIDARDLATLTAQTTLEPSIGLPVNPKIAGMDALGTTTLSGVGTTPQITWDPPTIGTAAKYYVVVFAVQNRSGATSLSRAAIIETTDTQVTIPPNVLASGQTYVFEIESRATTADLAASPGRLALPDATAFVTTTMVTP